MWKRPCIACCMRSELHGDYWDGPFRLLWGSLIQSWSHKKARFCLHVLEEIPFPTTVWMYKTLFLKRNIFTYQRVSQNSEPSTARTSNYGAKNALNMCISLVSPPRYTWRSFHPMPKLEVSNQTSLARRADRGPVRDGWGYVVSFPRSIPKDLDEAAIREARSMLVTLGAMKKKPGWLGPKRGWHPTQLYRDFIINHKKGSRIPINQPV